MNNPKKTLFWMAALSLPLVMNCFKSPTSVSSQNAQVSDMQKRVTNISAVVANLRGLTFVRPVHVGVISRADYSQNTAEKIGNSLNSVEQASLSKEYLQMGCLSETDTQIGQILTNYYSGFPAAYYVSGTDSLYILTDAYKNDTVLSAYISHELTHALQDQHLGMNFTIFPVYSYYDDDAYIAQQSLLEGDATFIEYAYMLSTYRGSDPYSDAMLISMFIKDDFLAGSDTTVHKPYFLNVKGNFPYTVGMAYVATQYSLSSQWNAVNALYSIASVPRSTAEINLVSAFTPRYFDFSAIQNLLVSRSKGIAFVDDDNGGFALLLGLFYRGVDTLRGKRSLDWIGDRYTFVMRNGQAYGTLVWAMAFKNADATKYVFSKLDSLIRSRRIGGKSPYYTSVDSTADSLGQGMTYAYASSVFTTTLRRTSSQVWWLENTDSLTRPILDILSAQQTQTPLAKNAASPPLPVPMTLSSSQKHTVVGGLLRHLFNKRHG